MISPWPDALPVLTTARLVLRPFQLSDASAVQRLAGAKEVAATTVLMPYPYPDGAAEAWIGTHVDQFLQRRAASFAVTLRQSQDLVGDVSLDIQPQHDRAELGYWIGVPYWNNGYCTEAAQAVVHYGFEALRLHRIYASHFASNPASGRVLAKLGMRHEGVLREHILKWGRYIDRDVWGLLAGE